MARGDLLELAALAAVGLAVVWAIKRASSSSAWAPAFAVVDQTTADWNAAESTVHG